MSAKIFLTDWIINFLKSKDAIFKRIISIEQNVDGFDIKVNYNDKQQYITVTPVLNDIPALLGMMRTDGHYGLVVLNTHNNLAALISSWNDIIKYRGLCIYFMNPFSNTDKKWIIFPYTHHQICDDTSLKTGLKSMFEMVDVLPDNAIEASFK